MSSGAGVFGSTNAVRPLNIDRADLSSSNSRFGREAVEGSVTGEAAEFIEMFQILRKLISRIGPSIADRS